MPTYVYRREDGSTFEIDQRITEDALMTCPETGQKVERIITGSAGLIFKGSGFYLTDYVRNNGASANRDGSGKGETNEGAAKDTAKADSTGKSSASGEKSAASSEGTKGSATTTSKE